MIIVNTKTETHFLNEKDFQEIVYRKDVQQVSAYRYIKSKNDIGQKLILNVTAVRYVTDATPYNDKIEKQPKYDVSRSIKIHNYEVTVNRYMEDAIDIIHRVCTSKDVNHKQAREKAIEVCNDCIAFVNKEFEKGKKEGYL